jgi:hypothetical protein
MNIRKKNRLFDASRFVAIIINSSLLICSNSLLDSYHGASLFDGLEMIRFGLQHGRDFINFLENLKFTSIIRNFFLYNIISHNNMFLYYLTCKNLNWRISLAPMGIISKRFLLSLNFLIVLWFILLFTTYVLLSRMSSKIISAPHWTNLLKKRV